MYRKFLRALKKSVGAEPPSLTTLSVQDQNLISRIRGRNLTYLSDTKLANLVQSCRSIEERNINGAFVEAGCALGGSSILISSIKKTLRPFFVYDVFGMIPAPTIQDPEEVHDRYREIREGKSSGIGGDKYYGYEEDLYEIVQSNLAEFGIDNKARQVTLIKGLVQDTMTLDQPIAFAHIDVDWYEPVKTCLERIIPNLSRGGILILDDYNDWGGCRKATDEYFRDSAWRFRMDDSAVAMKVTRV